MKRVAVLASGGGSNFQALLDYLESLGADAPARVVLVASDRAQAGALQKARDRQITTALLHPASDATNQELGDLLAFHRVDLVVLAGYLRLIPASVVDRYANRMVNVHPSLLPAHGGAGMYGLRVHQAVIDANEPVSGATVHFVTREYDRGPILAQWRVPVLPSDDAPTLARRVLNVEHVLYPRVIAALAAGKTDRFPLKSAPGDFSHSPVSADDIATQIDALLSS
jgi:phosphoribosylglycinamide formyltransferase 1